MNRRITALYPALAIIAAGTLPTASSGAQCRLCDAPTTEAAGIGQADAIDLQIEASLDFDRLVLLGAGEGTAELRPDGSRAVSGMVGAISSRAMVGSARVRGEPGRSVRIDLPKRIELHSTSGASIVIDDIVDDLPGAPKLDSAGGLTFRFGGRLRISGDAEGDYRGDVPITVEYL